MSIPEHSDINEKETHIKLGKRRNDVQKKKETKNSDAERK